MKNKKRRGSNPSDADKEVQEMIDTWDIVKCAYCGKEVSMLKAKLYIDEIGNEKFVCRKHE